MQTTKWGSCCHTGVTTHSQAPHTYNQKLSHDIFGVVSLCTNNNYVFHEATVGNKSSDQTTSCLDQCIREELPSWVKKGCIVLDYENVNKNQYAVAWLGELVRQHHLQQARFMLMIPGHTNFSLDMIPKFFPRSSSSFLVVLPS